MSTSRLVVFYGIVLGLSFGLIAHEPFFAVMLFCLTSYGLALKLTGK